MHLRGGAAIIALIAMASDVAAHHDLGVGGIFGRDGLADQNRNEEDGKSGGLFRTDLNRGGLLGAPTGAALPSASADVYSGGALLVERLYGDDDDLDRWDVTSHRAYTGVMADDPWCQHVGRLRDHLDGKAAMPTEDERLAALEVVRAEADATKGGDILWPFRKALICEYHNAAEQERREFDWESVAQFNRGALAALERPRPESGIEPVMPIYDYLRGFPAPTLQGEDVSTDAFCDSLSASERAIIQYRGELSEALAFPGSLRRAPDWYGHVHVAYHRYVREWEEGHQLYKDERDFGGIPWQCRRFYAAYEGSKEYAVKDNLIFLLPELDDPERAGRLEITDADGNLIILDEVLAAAQFETGGAEGEPVEIFAEDLAASASLKGAVDRTNDLPPPERYDIFYASGQTQYAEGDPNVAALIAALNARDPSEPVRVALTGHADCVGGRAANQRISQRRVDYVFERVIAPLLVERGFAEGDLGRRDLIKIDGVGAFAKAAFGDRGARRALVAGRCVQDESERRVSVIIQ